MLLDRPADQQISRYTGPYERWVFMEELGRPFAFPAVDAPDARHVGAILDGPGNPHDMEGAVVRVPPLWPSRDAEHPVTPFAFRDVSGEALSADGRIARRLGSLGDGRDGKAAPRVRLNLPLADASWVAYYAPDDPAAAWRKRATQPRAVLGVIDDGLPFASRSFLGAEGTRISHVWLQSARALPRDRIPFGREFVNGDIDALRAEHGTDECSLYRAAGAIDPDLPEIGRVLERRATHGSHIMGLGGGNGAPLPGPRLGDDIAIVAVQLPNTIAWDTSGFGKEMFMLAAIHYIFVRAAEIAAAWAPVGELPLVLNFSYGWNAGRHDGQSELEVAMEDLITRRRQLQPKTAIVLPVGNSFNADLHASFTSADFADGAATIGWRLPPDDRTSSYLEIWLPEGYQPDGWTVRVLPPPGIALTAGDEMEVTPDPLLGDVGDPRRFVEMEIDGRNVGQLSADLHRGSRWRILVAVIPTAETGHGRRLPSGLWRIEIDAGDGPPLGAGDRIELWVQRDDDPRQLQTGGRQSRLEGRPEDRAELVTGFGSLSAIATTPSVIRVAGNIGGTAKLALYSSASALGMVGEEVVTIPPTPTVAAPSEQAVAPAGLLSIGTLSGSFARLSGTSAAAALASRWMVANAAADHDLLYGGIPLPNQRAGPVAAEQKARLGEGRVAVDLSAAGWSQR